MDKHPKIVMVAGGTGGVGEGIVRAFLKQGHTVVVPSRNGVKLERLRGYMADLKSGTLLTHEGSVNNEENARLLSNFIINELGTIDIAVASLGGWLQGYPLFNYPTDQWNRILNDNLNSHFFAIKTFIPLLNKEQGFYLHINGFSAEQAYPGAGPVAMTAAAQKSMMLTLREELTHTGIQVHEFILGPIKTRDRLKHGLAGLNLNLYYPEEIGEYLYKVVSEGSEQFQHYLLSK